MAKKQKTVYICTECGNESNGWQGQCSFCGAWNSIVEQKVAPAPKESEDTRRRVTPLARPVPLSEVGTQNYSRIHSGSRELDRVLGDGIVLGSLILISGEPGIGKSTLIVQAANHIAGTYGKVLYVSGEESEEQVKLRADRVCGKISENLYIFPETNLENVLAHCENLQPCFVIIDSIQTVYSGGIDSVAGSVSQIRTCSNLLMNFAKTKNVPVMIVAHVTKSGELAGPKTIEHMVDCVLQFNGERDRDLRVLRSLKNRFGTTEEIGAFRMGPEGMKEENDLSGSLLENPDVQEEGSLVSAIYEGSRPVFFEIQALVSPSNVGFARRTALGIDQNRLNMILAVLEKKAGISLLNYDVYVNVVGGMRPDSTATDLAVALAIFSSFRGKCAAGKTIAIGEIGLTGNLRSVRNAEKIAAEAVRLGYEKIILPKKNSKFTLAGISIVGAENIMEAIRQAY
ncbi:MAG: DNA repair protein RadA [Mogibacterium sp.]|uniref:DNA repair protein RadA n=1 Tax=Mogibacterium sp. TaxID=2049035 RepID=UPI001A3CF359|nr:DNA repair protein RadA [Mogibacterium sp.]MBL6468969.1 DNA repair protein RadA [Mogibacterium sp.]